MNTESRSAGTVLIVMAAMLWGTTGTSQALAPIGATPLSISALRILVGGLALLALAWARGGFRGQARWQFTVTAAAAASTALYQVCFFGGVHLTGVAVGTMVGIGSSPVFAGILGAIFEGEQLTRRWWAATALAVIGCGLLLGTGASSVAVHPAGGLLALGAGLSYAVFTLANKRLIAHHTADEAMAVSFCLGAVLLLPLLLLNDVRWVGTPGGALVVLHLGLIATGLSYTLYGRGLRTVPVSTTATLSLAEPLTAALLGVLVVQERLSALGVLGMVLIFAGLVLLERPSRS